MLGFKQIEMTDKDILNMFFKESQNQNSECTFTNLYMWRRCFAVRWVTVEGHLIVEPNAFESSWVLPPYGYQYNDISYKHAIEILISYYHEREKPFVIRGVTEKEKERIEKLFPDEFDFVEERDIADYIYDAEDLRALRGRKYSKKRNHLNAFLKEYPDYVFEPVTTEVVPEALDFLERWYGQRNKAGEIFDSMLCEREAIYDALTHLNQLDFVGGLIRINGKIVALTFGEKLRDDTVVIHIEKAYPDYRGLYAIINKEYLNRFWPKIEYVNREEDMGNEGLRQAKMSYYPAYLLNKYKAVLKNEKFKS